jgi:hypothetical protein
MCWCVGWIDASNETDPEDGRSERIRLLSTDGLRDPRNEKTDMDTEFDILHDLSVFPATFQAAGEIQQDFPSLEQAVAEYQKMMKRLEGRASFNHDLSAYP